MKPKQYGPRIDQLETIQKINDLSSILKVSENEVVKRATLIGLEVIEKKYNDKNRDKSSDEMISEIFGKMNEGFKIALRNQDEMKFEISILQSVIFSLLNVKAMELEKGNGEISSEDLTEGLYDEPPKWIDELIKTE